jgi:hypothetical protein
MFRGRDYNIGVHAYLWWHCCAFQDHGIVVTMFCMSLQAWAHFDIAGAAMTKKQDGHRNAGGNGWGVHLIVSYIKAYRIVGSGEGSMHGFATGPDTQKMSLKCSL